MKIDWKKSLIESLKGIDRDQAPHGIYGMRQAYSSTKRLPSFQTLFCSPECRRVFIDHGFNHLRNDKKGLHFDLEGGTKVALYIADFADTKVRKFGSSYLLDKKNRKETLDEFSKLEKVLPKLWKEDNRAFSSSNGLRSYLLIAHFQKKNEFEKIVTKVSSREFLERYRLSFLSEMWEDKYNRGFFTTISIWNCSSPDRFAS